MIYYVKGNFVEKTATNVVVDCSGVGYDVQISLNTFADIEPLNQGLLYTYHLVREGVARGEWVTAYINTHDNIADLLTKPVISGEKRDGFVMKILQHNFRKERK